MSAPRELPPAVVLERPPVDWERLDNGRPKIKPPPGVVWRSASGKTRQRYRSYTRTTTYADAISDQYNLMQWKMRRVALGMGQRPDYVRLAAALTDRDDDRDALDELVGKALEAAGPNKADEGTALHALTERIDRDEDLGNPPPEILPDLAAYEALSTAAFRYVYREARTVCDALEVAGTPDGHAWVGEPCPAEKAGQGCPGLHIVDTKTGSIRYPGKMSTQLAIYAHSDLYDPDTGARTPVDVCKRWGVIVHLPVEEGRAAPYWLDLGHGWAGAVLCGPVRAWNAVRADDILVPFRDVEPVKATAGGAIEVASVRLASSKGQAAPPQELTELAEVDELRAVEANPLRCELTDLLVEQCACPVHRGGSTPEEEADTELDFTSPDPLHAEIEAQQHERDLEVLWQRRRTEWHRGHLEHATRRFTELRELARYERPRAAIEAVIEAASTVEELTATMLEVRDSPAMTPELRHRADERYWSLLGQRRHLRAVDS